MGKNTSDGSKKKARLVARGFEDVEKNSIQSDSPTCAKESLWLLFAVSARNKWEIQPMDIKTALFLSSQFEREGHLKKQVPRMFSGCCISVFMA